MMNGKRILQSLSQITGQLRRIHVSLAAALLCGFVLAGAMYSFLTPAFRAPDEPAHWDAAVRRMDGVKTLESHCSKSLTLFNYLRFNRLIHGERVLPGKYQDIDNVDSTCVGPHIWSGNALTYYGYVIADTFMTRLMSFRGQLTQPVSAVISYFAARFLQGLLIAALLARMIWLSRNRLSAAIGNLWIGGLALTPLFVQQSHSISADGIILVAAIACVNLVSALPKIRITDALIFLFAIYNATIAKPTYAPAFGTWILMLFLIAHLRPRTGVSLRERIRTALNPGKSVETALFYATAVLILIVGIQYVTLDKPPLFTPSPEVDPGKQLAFIREHLRTGLATVRAGIMSFYKPLDFWVPLGWFDFPPSDFTRSYWSAIYTSAIKLERLTAWALLAGFIFSLRKNWRAKTTHTAATIIACSVGVGGIYLAAFAASLSMYLYWTPVGKATVDGMQVRYFFPLLIMAIGLARFAAQEILPAGEEESDDMSKSGAAVLPPAAISAARAVWYGALTLVGFHVLIFIVSLAFDTLKRYY